MLPHIFVEDADSKAKIPFAIPFKESYNICKVGIFSNDVGNVVVNVVGIVNIVDVVARDVENCSRTNSWQEKKAKQHFCSSCSLF